MQHQEGRKDMAITVNSRSEAWNVADIIFPTDYIKNDQLSANAGYPILESTADGNSSWISDLGSSLELNIISEHKEVVKTTRIIIVEKPQITETHKITADGVRGCCIHHNLYTAGSCRDYDFMLNYADTQDYSLETLYELAEDICKHSVGQTITNVMFLLRKDAVITTYEINGQDDI